MNEPFGIIPNHMRTVSGRDYDFVNPTSDQVDIIDIAHALSMICRFGGNIPAFYSVAEHAINCMRYARDTGLSPVVQFACLNHDDTEAILGDVIKPLKIVLGSVYEDLENKNEAAICTRYNIDLVSTKDDWKRIDHILLFAERNAFYPRNGNPWNGENTVEELVNFQPLYLSPPKAKDAFLFWFETLRMEIKHGA